MPVTNEPNMNLTIGDDDPYSPLVAELYDRMTRKRVLALSTCQRSLEGHNSQSGLDNVRIDETVVEVSLCIQHLSRGHLKSLGPLRMGQCPILTHGTIFENEQGNGRYLRRLFIADATEGLVNRCMNLPDCW